MHDANILIVEDESITALGIKHKLERLGYSVAAVESSGEGAIKKTRELKPDIILMDIVLKGEMDGIEAAHEINHSFNIPIVYLTAYSDNSILERAKLTRPSGYITKPFSDADLKSAIEIALYNHPSNVFDPANEELKKNDLSEASADETEFHSKILNDLKEIEEKYRTLFNKSPDNVIILGADGKLMDLNEAALKNTGKKREDLIGKHFSELELLPDEDMPLHLEKLKQVLKDGANEPYEARFIDKDGQIQYIELYTNPLKIDDEIFAIQIISHDFTELKKANEAISETLASKSKILKALRESLAVKSKILDEFKESEEKYRQLVENAREGICSTDLEGTITFVNPRMAEMFGYTTSSMQGKSIFSFITENQVEEVQKYLNSPNDTLKGHFDFEFIKKDGKKIFTSIETSIIRDEDGNKKGILALVADVSRGKKAENRLKENEEYLKTIFATVQTGIIVIDSKSKEIIDVNKAASNLIGLSRDEIIGKVCHRFICPHEEGHCPITDLNQRVDNSQRVLLTANNEEIPIIKNVVYTNLKGRKCVLESFIDISKLKKLEESLKESKEWYKALIEASPEAIIAMDRDGVINFASSKSLELFGFEKIHHLLNKNMLELMAPECHKKVESDMLKIMDGEYTQNLEYKFMKSNGTIFTGEVNLSVIKDNKGVSQSIIFILRDITEIKNAEKQIKASLKEKEVLLREIHHRVKNNLQIISSLLSLQSGYLLDDETQDIFTESQNRIRTMAMIHEKLYKSESLVKINFKDYINDLTENLFYNYKISPNMIKLYNNIEDLSFDINTAIPCGLIINELVTNCIKHAFPWFKTPMSLKESSEDLEFGKYKIEIQLHLDNGNYVLSVADNGVGIPDDFDFNETNSLGLKLVNNLVEQLDGTMTLDNTSGSKFTIVFKENNYQERI